MIKCDNCGKSAKFALSSLVGTPTLCQECKQIGKEPVAATNEDWEKLEVISNVDEIPDSAKDDILSIIKEKGLDPAKGRVVALDLNEPAENLEDVMSLLKLQAARSAFISGVNDIFSAIHMMSHLDFPEDELRSLVKRFTSFQYDLATEHLFRGDIADEKTEAEVLEMNLDACFNCGGDDDV